MPSNRRSLGSSRGTDHRGKPSWSSRIATEYIPENVFCVPAEARWAHLRAQARQSNVGLTVAQPMAAIERDNPTLKTCCRATMPRPPSTSDGSAS